MRWWEKRRCAGARRPRVGSDHARRLTAAVADAAGRLLARGGAPRAWARGAGRSVEPLEGRTFLSAARVTAINPISYDSNPAAFTDVNGTAYFTVTETGTYGPGSGLWRTDGTAAGTVSVRPFNGGGTLPTDLTSFGGVLYFRSNKSLWRSDGTEAGTTPVHEFAAMYNGLEGTRNLLASGGALYFAAVDDPFGGTAELWRSDGTVAGTSLVKDINPTGSSSPQWLTSFGGAVYFTANDGANGRELWRTDGTAGGTVLVKDVRPGATGSNPANLVVAGGTLYFTADNGVSGVELWKSDGTPAGTTLVADLTPGAGGFVPARLTAAGGLLYFTNPAGGQVWRTDGTGAGTAPVRTLARPADTLVGFGGTLYFGVNAAATADGGLWRSDGTVAGTARVAAVASVSQLTAAGGALYFRAPAVVAGGTELWRSDGTPAGTGPLAGAGADGNALAPRYFAASGGRVYFAAADGVHGTEVWATDGTPAGTGMVRDVNASGPGTRPQNLTLFRGQAFFTASPAYGTWGLYRTDGTPAGTSLVAQAPALGTFQDVSPFASLTAVGGTLYFLRSGSTGGAALWATDGTPAGTRQVRQFQAVTEMAAAGGTLYFTAAYDATTGYELWRTDGTTAGTAIVKDIAPGGDSSYPKGLTAVGADLFFWAGTAAGYELWKSDGTAAGTALVKDINPAGSSAFTTAYQNTATAVLDGVLYFAADDGVHGRELWRSDGTPAGTVLVSDVLPGDASGVDIDVDEVERRRSLVAVPRGPGKGVYWFGNSSAAPFALYKSDGTAAGTGLLAALQAGDSDSPVNLTVVGDQLFFTDPDRGGNDAYRVYRSDGTAAGTRVVHSFQSQNIYAGLGPGYLADVGGVAYFTALDESDGAGNEVWRSDGTAAGTVRVTDLAPGVASAVTGYYASDPAYAPLALSGSALFPLTDGTLGLQVWRVTAEPPPPPPAGASGLAAAAVNGVRVDLTWQDNSADEVGFRLERSTSPTFATVQSTQYLLGGTTSFSDVGLAESTTYYYRVLAYNGGGDAAAAATATAVTPDTPTSPSGLTAVAAAGADSGRRVDLAWTDNSSNELGFRLERSFSATFANVDQTWTLPPGTTTFADATVAPLAAHYYRLRAFNAVGDSALVATASVTTPDVLPAAPTGLLAWGISDTAIQLRWTDNAVNEQAYLVERSTGGGPFAQISEVTGGRPYYVDEAVVAGAGYAYRVRAKGAAGSSEYAAVATAAPLPPQLTGLVMDVNGRPLGTSSSPGPAALVNGVSYFAAAGTTGGQELWRTDGTPGGTYRVADVNPGAAGSNPAGLTAANGTIYFFADGGAGRSGLWRSDGTAAGTAFVAAVSPVPGVQPAAAADGTLYFAAADAAAGAELWRSDGTAAGTGLLADLAPGPGGSSPTQLTAAGTTVYFTAAQPGTGPELYKTDGTAAGTGLVKDVFPGTTVGPTLLGVVGGAVLFRGNDGTTGGELWRSDGTAAGTALVADLNPGAGSSNPRYAAVVGSKLFFAADGPAGTGLYKSDGTAAGTALVKTLPASVDRPWLTMAVDGVVYFVLGLTGGTVQTLLYKSDGTDAGTVAVADATPGTPQGLVADAVAAGGAFYFVAPRPAAAGGGRDLWRSDGTAAGTVTLTAGYAAGPVAATAALSAAGGAVLFRGVDATGSELWRSDGTPAGTGRLKDLAPQTGDANPALLTRVGDAAYFAARDAAGVPGLYRTDGTEAGTALVAAAGTVTAVAAGPGGAAAVVFATLDAGTARLWATDGSAGGAVAQLSAALPTAAAVDALYAAGPVVYFRLRNPDGSYQLWRTDGTAAGTARVGDVNPVAVNAAGKPTAPVVAGGVLYFAATSPSSATGLELWRTDGTAAGTQLVGDVNPGAADGGPFALTAVGGRVFFVARDPARGWALWRTDADGATAVVVRDGFTDGTANPALGNLAAVGGALYFAAADPNYGLSELWRSDGTTAGTTLVADLDPGFGGSSPTQITDVGGVAYFLATDAARGPGLWRSDGTAAGTARVTDVAGPGAGPSYILGAGGVAYFADGGYLWKTDGTTTGTVRQMAIGPSGSPAAAEPTAAVVGGRLVFAAATLETGRELWQLSLAAAPAAPSAVVAYAATLSGGVRVGWQDNAVDETGYEVERLVPAAGGGAATVAATFYLPADATQLIDPSAPAPLAGTAAAMTQYRVRAYNAGGASAGTAVTVSPLFIDVFPPNLVSTTVDDGSAQRSQVRRVTLRFDRPVTLGAGAVTLTRHNTGGSGANDGSAPTDVSAALAAPTTPDGGLNWVYTFAAGAFTEATGSLSDGVYTLTVNPAGVAGGGVTLQASVTTTFHRLFGDQDGNKQVNNADYVRFRAAFGSSAGSAAYNGIYDFDGNGMINNADYLQFRSRFGKAFTY